MAVDVAKVKELFLAVLEMPAQARPSYLDTACGGDTALRAQIEAMLKSHDNSGELLPRAPAEMLTDGAATQGDATAAYLKESVSSATQVDGAHADLGELTFLAPSTR